MSINRNNYEAYLLDLSEGKLSDELQHELNYFLAQNPDLETELIDDNLTLNQNHSEFSIDKDLLKFDSINSANRKHFFIAYHEGDLTPSEQLKVLEFISKNTALKHEFSEFSKLYLKGSTTVFEDKKSLHSIATTSGNTRGIIYWSVRVAAILIIGFILNGLYQNANNNTEPKYTLSKNHTYLKPILKKENEIDYVKFFQNKKSMEFISNNKTLVDNEYKKNYIAKKETKKVDSLNPLNYQKNSNSYPEKGKIEVLPNNPLLDNVIATLNHKSTKEENNIIVETLPTKTIKTPPSILAYLGEKAKEKKVLTENGRPDIISLLNKGSNSLSGQDVLAKSETEESNSTIFKLGGLKIERITKK